MRRPWRVKHRSVGHLVCCMPWGSETVEEKEHLTTCRAWPRQLSGPVSSPASIVAAPGQNDFHLKATFSTQVPFPTTVMATVCNLLCNLRCNLRCNHRSNLWSSTALYAELPHRMRHSVYSIPSDERLTVCGAPSSDGMLPISYAELPHRMECCLYAELPHRMECCPSPHRMECCPSPHRMECCPSPAVHPFILC